MSKSRTIRNALKKRLEPHLADEGFLGRYPHFRRPEGDMLHLLSVVHDKWGGGFVLEFGPHAPGPLKTSWGTVVAEEDLEIGYVPPGQRARLVATERGQGMYEDFFRYDDIADQREACDVLVGRVVALFPQVNAWLRTRQVGPNIAAF